MDNLKGFWKVARWILLALFFAISGAGCANWAYTNEPAFWVIAAGNWTIAIAVGIKAWREANGTDI